MASNNCCCGGTTILLACSGGSNVGQLTNEAAKKLDTEGSGRFFCLAGVGGHISGMTASVSSADRVLAIDGCDVACAKKCLEAAGIESYEYVVVTDLGIEKNHSFDLSDSDIESVSAACRAKLKK